jgi:hypothetical protein
MWGVRGGVAVLALALAAEGYRVLLGRNLHVVVAGRVYRSAQPSAAALEDVVRDHGIRTVVNLRGCCSPMGWYEEEARACHRLGVSQEDVCLSAYRLPAVSEIHRLLEVLDRTAYPILLHCRRGADRTGLVSAVVLLLQTDTPVARARGQLGWRYGHLAAGRPAVLDRFFDLYSEWLAKKELPHSPAVFRRWLEQDYCPGPYRCHMDARLPTHLRAGEPAEVRVRVRNTSGRPWRLEPGAGAGVHLGWILCDLEDHWICNGRAGLFHAEVAPGQTHEFTMVLPPFRRTGRYRLVVDMVDEQQCWFFQTGSEPLEEELDIGL